MTVVIVQCRLSSTRLFRKALKDLGGKPILTWVLNSMKKVVADEYYVATDEESFEELENIALDCGWKIFAGSKDNVLDRFCTLIKKVKADVVVRATADNPFLFYEAAQSLLDEFLKVYKKENVDYMTFSGLPHGSGVEVFNAHSLLKASELTSNPYDTEHVGPALYNHKDVFVSVFKKVTSVYYNPNLRTTVDTLTDYIRCNLIVKEISKDKNTTSPYSALQIIKSFENPCVKNLVLLVPCVKKGHGTGHLRRCLDLACKLSCSIYIPKDSSLDEKNSLVKQAIENGLCSYQIVDTLPQKNEYSLILTDSFSLDSTLSRKLHSLAPVASLDEGCKDTAFCDYLLNIIPSINSSIAVNRTEHSFMDLPKNKRQMPLCKSFDDIKTILVCLGGEDPANLAIPTSIACAKLGKNVTVVTSKKDIILPKELEKNISVKETVPMLKERLFNYDLVITHYGLTAWEAVFAGCAVLLLGTTPLHIELAKKYGFVHLKNKQININELKKVLENTKFLYLQEVFNNTTEKAEDLSTFVVNLANSNRILCPICSNKTSLNESIVVDRVVERTSFATFRRCSCCGMLYMSYCIKPQMSYSQSYFFEQYKAQYGKTYLEDFDSIKKQCQRRVSKIDGLLHKKIAKKSDKLSVLDIGCAYGPFLSAAFDSGWNVFGTDISQDAIDYVKNVLKFTVSCAEFPNFDSEKIFNKKEFDCVSMWFVIEHFKNLGEVLSAVGKIVKKGGVFAFSTPCASGISAKSNKNTFFMQNPSDHYTLWERKRASKILYKFGFKVVKIVSTGHHPERFPIVKKYGWKKDSIPYRIVSIFSYLFNLGDTFEIYCKKIEK